jgi:hypothetical protein
MLEAFMKKLLKKIRSFWWGGFWHRSDFWSSNISRQPVITHHQRNDEDYELKKRMENPLYLERFGYKVYSQNDEDGIIEEIFNRIGTNNKKFIEFGVENGLESNSHFLLHKDWHGLWIEGSEERVKEIRLIFKSVIDQKRLNIINGFITKENINDLIKSEPNYCGEIDLLRHCAEII